MTEPDDDRPDGHEEHPLTTALPCQVHRTHTPKSHINERHHVWPLGLGGPTTADNIVVVCATGHNNIHALLDAYLKGDGVVAYRLLRSFTIPERQLALLGYQRSRREAM